jgi:hypothetical protein
MQKTDAHLPYDMSLSSALPQLTKKQYYVSNKSELTRACKQIICCFQQERIEKRSKVSTATQAVQLALRLKKHASIENQQRHLHTPCLCASGYSAASRQGSLLALRD